VKRAIAILGAGRLQEPFIREGRLMGYEIIALDQKPDAHAAKAANKFIVAQISDAAAVLDALNVYRSELLFVCTVATDFTQTVGIVNDALGLRGPNTEQGRVLTHKGAMRDFCRDHSHTHPPYVYSRLKNEIEAWAKANPCKDGFVIKPVENMGARGVMFIESTTELCFAHEFASSQDKNGEVILEHYVPAREISVDALCFDGEVFLTGVADRLIEIKDGHFFIENGHTLPGNLTAFELEKIRLTMQRYGDSLKSLGTARYHGALKGDLRLTAQGEIVIGEIAGRLSGGFMSTHTYPAAHGRSLMQMYIRLMLGDKSVILDAETAVRADKISIERSIYAAPGEIQGLKSADEIERIKTQYGARGLIELICNYKNGDIISSLQNNIGKVYHSVWVGADAEGAFKDLTRDLAFTTNTPGYNGRAFAKIARESFDNKFCWVCKVCDGDYCASSVPGMGGRGEANTFRDNINALQEYKVETAYASVTHKIATPDTRFTLFAKHELQMPLFSAPITGSVTNMGGSITEFDYAIESGTAMLELGGMPTFGDGATADKYRVGLHAIKQLGTGIPVFKPREDQTELKKRITEAESAGAIAWGIDIDGVSFKTMVARDALTEHKSVEKLTELRASSSLPMLVKGVMSVADAASAAQAGASAIVVSNHGGRVLDGMPGTARILPQIASYVRIHAPQMQILVDGGIRSGSDIFRMLALGADAVMIGRPIAIMTVALGRTGVKSMLEYWMQEFKQTMRVLGIANLKEISPKHISKFL